MQKIEKKDKKVQIFALKTIKRDNFEQIQKCYIHSQKSGGLWAYVRELSENERFSAKSVQVEETTQFKIVYNPKLTTELYIEFSEKTYEIVAIDKFEFNKTDLIIRANEILAPAFDEVVYEDY